MDQLLPQAILLWNYAVKDVLNVTTSADAVIFLVVITMERLVHLLSPLLGLETPASSTVL
jgi:hypothetical protein